MVRAYAEALGDKVEATSKEMSEAARQMASEDTVREVCSVIQDALNGEGWRSLFPGRELLHSFATANGLPKNSRDPFINSVLEKVAQHPGALQDDF